MEAVEYHETCAAFLQAPDKSTLRSLEVAVKRTSPDIVRTGEVDSILKQLKSFLTGNDMADQLLGCLLVLRFQRLDPSNQWVGAILDETASTFRDVSIKALTKYDSGIATMLVDSIGLWTDIARNRHLEEHQFFVLFTSAMYWIFQAGATASADGHEKVRITRKMVDFVAVSYANLPPSTCDQIVHQMISEWRQYPQSFREMTDLLLKLVASAGQIPMSKWEEATTFKSRTLLEEAALVAHSKAKQVAQLVSRRLIDMSWSKSQNQRGDLDILLAECLRRCLHPQWVSAELFMSAFLTTLFRLSTVFRGQKYPLFMLDMVRNLYEILATLETRSLERNSEPKHTALEKASVSGLVTQFVGILPHRDQALYLASRQMVEAEQPYFDYYNALTRPKVHIGAETSDLQGQDWLRVLSQWPLVTYHSQIVNLLCEMARKKDLKDALQVDLFKNLERVVVHDPTKFDLQWMDRLSSAVPAVCETFIPLASHMYNVTGDEAILQKLATRMRGPGAFQFKKRALSLIMKHSRLLSLKWQVLLVTMTDTDPSLRSIALQLAREWLDSNGPTQELAQALVESQSLNGGRYRALVKQGLAELMQNLNRLELSHIQALVASLLSRNELKLALVFIGVDGRVTPLNSVKPMFAKVTENSDRSLALQILNFSLCARPRLILPSSLGETMFSELLKLLKSANETDMDSISSILGQLVSLGGATTQEKRTAILNSVFQSAFALARKNQHGPNPAVLTQAVLICGGSRFWPLKATNISELAHMLVDWTHQETRLPMRLLYVRVVFALASHHETLFMDKKIDKFFSSFTSSSEESNCLTRQLLKLLWTPKAISSAGMDHDLSEQANISTLAPSHTPSSNFETVSALLLQKQLDRLISIAFSGEDVNALKVIVKAMENNLVVADECIPLVTSMAFAADPAVAQTALKSFTTICERWPRNAGTKFLEGLQRLPPEPATINPFPSMWQRLRQSQHYKRGMKPLLDDLSRLLNWQTDIKLLKLLINGLTNVELDSRDAKHLVQLIEDFASMFDANKHDNEETSKLCLVFLFAVWLRRKYHISETASSYKSNLVQLAASADPSSKTAVAAEQLEPINCDEIWQKLMDNPDSAAHILQQLWRLPNYGSTQMDKLLSLNIDEPKHKRVKVDNS